MLVTYFPKSMVQLGRKTLLHNINMLCYLKCTLRKSMRYRLLVDNPSYHKECSISINKTFRNFNFLPQHEVFKKSFSLAIITFHLLFVKLFVYMLYFLQTVNSLSNSQRRFGIKSSKTFGYTYFPV